MISDYVVPFANHLWQSTLFAIAVWVITLALRKNRAAVRHRLWLAASIKFLVPFSLLAGIGSYFQWQMTLATPPLPVSMLVETISGPFSSSTPSLVPSGSTVPLVATPAPELSRLPNVLITVWIFGVATSLFWWFVRWRQVRRVVRLATSSILNGPLRVVHTLERFEPGVFGIFSPVLMLPEGIAHRLSPAQLQAVLAHELCHVQRRDNLTTAIHMFVEALFWFHPLVWWIKARLLDEQERACDEEVLRLGNEPMVYAESLLKVCEFYVELPLTCVSGVTGSDLKERLRRIMRNQIGETLNHWRKLILVTAGIAALAMPVLFGHTVVQRTAVQSHPAQQPEAAPQRTFEVASIRPEPSAPPVPSMAPPAVAVLFPTSPLSSLFPPPLAPPGLAGPPPPSPSTATLVEKMHGVLGLQGNAQEVPDTLQTATVFVLFRGDAMVFHDAPSAADIGNARTAHQAAGGTDLLWFRLEGRCCPGSSTEPFVVLDKAVLDRVNELYVSSQQGELARMRRAELELMELLRSIFRAGSSRSAQ